MVQFNFTINNSDGIHARPAGQLVKEAQKCKSVITIIKGEKKADLKRLFAVLGLNIKQDDNVTMIVEGEDEEQAAVSLEEYMKANL